MRYIFPSRPSRTSRALPKLGRLGIERAEPDLSLARARAWESQLGMTRTRAESYRAEPARLALPSLSPDVEILPEYVGNSTKVFLHEKQLNRAKEISFCSSQCTLKDG